VKVQTVAADLSTGAGVDRVAEICAAEPLTLLVNNFEWIEFTSGKARDFKPIMLVPSAHAHFSRSLGRQWF
jgi:uncharacterized protein